MVRLFEKLELLARAERSDKMVEHKQITVFDSASNGVIEVDEGIVPLLELVGRR